MSEVIGESTVADDSSCNQVSEDLSAAEQLDPSSSAPSEEAIDNSETGESLAGIKLRIEKSKADRREQSNKMRQKVSETSLRFVKGQLIASDALVVVYVIWQLVKGDSVPPEIIVAWMSASLIEVIGILWVITRSLFPFHDKHHDKDAEAKKSS